METLEAIHTRQSIGQVRPDPVPREFRPSRPSRLPPPYIQSARCHSRR